MPPQVLVAFCTRSGSTWEVAEEIGRIVRSTGATVAVKHMAEVQSIEDGQSVILGGALYVGRLPKDFHGFLARFERELASQRPWVFVLGPIDNEAKHFAAAEEQVRKELAKHPVLHPADVRVFGGKFDPKKTNLPFPFNLLMKLPGNPMHKVPASDIRDWEWIRSWAGAIADRLNAIGVV